VLEQIVTGSVDLAVLGVGERAPKLPARVTIQTIDEQPLWLMASPDDALIGPDARPISLDALRGRPVILPERGGALRHLLARAFTAAGFSPLPFFETSHPQTIRRLVAAGLGLSIVPAAWLQDGAPPVATRPLDLPAYRVALLSASEPRIPARDLLLEHLLHTLAAP
jgi:DNA-binding transcriptional LysR family regulator